MNIETRSKALNRKRNRQPQFDLNRTIPHELPKVRRTQFPERRMSNPPETSRNQFIDLSHSINAGNQASNTNMANVVPNSLGENITPEVREMVADEALVVQRSLEDKVRKMVQDEMGDIRKSLAELTKCVLDLSKSNSQNQNAIVSNPNVSVPSSSSGTSQTGDRKNFRLASESLNGNMNNVGNVMLPLPRMNEAGVNPQNNEMTRIRVDKLGIIFDGNPAHLSIDDFIFRLEHLQLHYQIPWAEILRDFHQE